MLSVAVITYNQENYISQTLDNILKQEHNYSYEIVIGDDCSKDGTRNIISDYVKKYPDIIKPIYNNHNLGLIKNYFNVINHCSGKYIMECAGDDWWLPGKVTTQMEFMETHRDAGMCYGKVKLWNEGKQTFEKKSFGSKITSTKGLLDGNTIPAVTVCFKNELVRKYISEIKPEEKSWKMEDYPLWIFFSHESLINYQEKHFAVYRVLDNSVSHNSDVNKEFLFEKSRQDIQKFFSNLYGFSLKDENDHYIYFSIYLRKLYKNYDKNTAVSLRKSYIKMNGKDIKSTIIYVCSWTSFFWKILMSILKNN